MSQQNQNQLSRRDEIRMNALVEIKRMSNSEAMKAKFAAILKDRAPAFMASVLNATRTNPSLLDCDQNSLWASALVAATLDLPIDGNLGFAALVPYKDNGKDIVQFQMMYRGFIQLAVRSGQYRNMNVSEIYLDELKSYNPITKELVFTPQDSWKMRDEGNQNNIAGYYASFQLNSGFTMWLYMSKQAVEKHAKKYSQTYKQGKGQWVRDFHSMALKTVIKRLLSHWGILSIEMQQAIVSDQASFIDVKATEKPIYPDNDDEELPTIEVQVAQLPAPPPPADDTPEVFK